MSNFTIIIVILFCNIHFLFRPFVQIQKEFEAKKLKVSTNEKKNGCEVGF